MGDPPVTLRQQYGPKVEKVPRELNARGVAIDISGVPYDISGLPYDSRVLLFRDVAFGDKLVTARVARSYTKGLETLTSQAEREFQEMLRRLPSIGAGQDTFIYVGCTSFPFD